MIIGSPGKDRDRLVLRLETLGYVCETSDSVNLAYSLVAEVEPDILAVASDGRQDDAWQFIREVQESTPYVRAIVYGGAPNPDDVVEAIRSGASDWITLPTDHSRIPERMEQLMARVRAHRGREERLKELANNCKELSEARDEMSEQVDVLCGDLASAYRSMRSQMTDVAMSSEFKTLVSQELDVEDMLRTSLEYILKRIGPTNAVVYLKEGDDQYGVGAYVNYQWQDKDLMPMLHDLGDVVCKPMSNENDLIRFEDTSEFANTAGGSMKMIEGADMAAFSCHRGEECLAVFVLFRDAEVGFDDQHATTLDVLRTIITEQLSQIIRVHKRSRPEWPDEPADDGWNLAA
jgi:DNA-binding response OmpR family regulator